MDPVPKKKVSPNAGNKARHYLFPEIVYGITDPSHSARCMEKAKKVCKKINPFAKHFPCHGQGIIASLLPLHCGMQLYKA